ncbi:MAG: DNA-processing protein DprA [Gammaproteobacteria bacterium]
MKTLPYWLALNRVPGLGPKGITTLLQQFGNIELLFQGQTPISELQHWLQTNYQTSTFDWRGVERDLAWLEASESHHVVTVDDSHFPYLLRETPGSPFLLFVRGDPKWLSLPQVAMVGTRHPTPLGLEQAYEFAQGLVTAGLTVTSGLALGIDGASHEGALKANGGTIAVMGHGLDSLYPKAHQALAAQIVGQGALISEFPIGTPPLRQHFPRRNRIISALSGGVLVVEAALKSGSLITAQYALEQGREVFALPGSIHNPTAKGCHQLIRQGAHLIETVKEIIEVLTPFYADWQPEREYALKATRIAEQISKGGKASDNVLLAAIGDCLTPIDVLIQRTGLSLQRLTSELLDLELDGQVKAVPGGYVRIATGG